jgi:DNA modification methylase
MGEQVKLINADCIEAMKAMPDNSVDSIVTDPPYELGFMGKSWDASGIAFNVEVWREALRVIKPGGHLIAFSGSRTYHRMAVAIEDAGFEIRDQIMWVYGSGFPKSHNVSKGIDKSDAVEIRRQRDLKFTEWMRSTGITGKQINDLTESNMGNHYLTDKEQPAVATAEMFNKLRPFLPEVPEWVEQMVRERTIESENFKKREVVGVQKNAMAGWSMDGTTQFADRDITTPATPAAKQWDGWGTALKPAHEPMVLARKPLIGTVANNVLTHGTGGLNIDGSRVVAEGENFDNLKSRPIGKLNTRRNDETDEEFDVRVNESPEQLAALAKLKELGRWPANFIYDGSDEVVALFPNSNGAGGSTPNVKVTGYGDGIGNGTTIYTPNDRKEFNSGSGSAARFFYCAKASKRDRNEGLDGFEAKRDHDGRADGGVGGDNPRNRTNNAKLNHHPTVKPTTLMQYLVRLVTPPSGIVLDPFMGSGSTGKACAYEGFDFIGIDQSAEYVAIAQARIDFAVADKSDELPL